MNDRIYIEGGHQLKGSIRIQGSKNAALPMLAAALLNRGTTKLYHCPKIADVDCMLDILKSLGCEAKWEEGAVRVDSSQADSWDILNGGVACTFWRSQSSLSGRVCHWKAAP